MNTHVSVLGNLKIPLCFLPSGNLVYYSNGIVEVMKEEKSILQMCLPISTKEKFFGKFRYLSRLFRLGIRTAEALNESHIVYSKGNMIHEIDLANGSVSKGYYCGEGIRPLKFTVVKDIKGFDDGLYFGGYRSNPNKESVYVYKRVCEDNWEIIYSFPKGAINHVHTIVSDPFRQCLWIFTGDFEESAAIWKVTNNFKNVERIACNNQKFRGCVVFALPEGLLYATDAPFASNHLYLMNTDTYCIIDLKEIDGSCIYGCQWKDNFVFSSTVEPDGRYGGRLTTLFGRKRGAGIKDEYVHMYCGNVKNGFREIYKEKKDRLPYASFQFGVFKFPYGVNNTGSLYFQPIATQKNDLKLLKYYTK